MKHINIFNFYTKYFENLQNPTYICIAFISIKAGLVVQLVRMPACHAGGRGFESRPDRKTHKALYLNW